MYKIKGSEDLFTRWNKLANKTNKKLHSIEIMQNPNIQIEVTKQDLNKWYHDSMDEITKVKEDFDKIVKELISIRQEIMDYIRDQIRKDSH